MLGASAAIAIDSQASCTMGGGYPAQSRT